MEDIFYNGFSSIKQCTTIEDAFSTTRSLRTDFYSMLWVTDGFIELSIDEVSVMLEANQMTFITPVKYVKILNDQGKSNVIQFNQEFYCIRENDHEVSCEGVLYSGTQGLPIIKLNDQQVQSFERLFGVLQEEFEIVDTIQEEMLRTILKKWLIKATRIHKAQYNIVNGHESKLELLRQFKILLEKNYSKMHKVSDYAALLNKSPKTITNQFKLMGQEKPSTIIQQRIIIEAKRLLLYSSLSIKEISFKLGFDDASSFSHYFKSKTSLSAKQFKEMS